MLTLCYRCGSPLYTGERQPTRQNIVALIVPWTLFFLCTIGAVFIAGFLCLLKHFTKVTPESQAEGSHSQLKTDRTRELDEDLSVKRENLSVKRELDEDLSEKRELDEERDMDEDLSVIALTQ